MSKEKKISDLPNQTEIKEFFQKQRICLYCKKPFRYFESFGVLNCARHLTHPIKRNPKSEAFYLCCGKQEGEEGCQICDHSELEILEDTTDIPFYYIKNNFVRKPDEAGIKEGKRFQFKIDENGDSDEENLQTDLFKSYFKIKRIKKK